MTSNIDYIDKIPNNVDLGRDRVLQRALEHWQPAYMGWWYDMGPNESHNYDVYLRTAISVDPEGWAQFDYVKMPDYRWGIFVAPPTEGREVNFGANKGQPAWQDVPGEYRSMLRRIIVTQGDTEPASVEQQKMLGMCAPSLYDLRNIYQVNVEEGRHLWAMVYLLHRYFGRDGREEAEALLDRRSGDVDNPRILGAFNEPTPDWLAFYMFTFFTDRDGKFQLSSLAESGFDPLARTCRFMLTEEAHHMFVGETGIGRIVQRTAEVMAEHKLENPDQVRALGVIDLQTIQRYLNFHYSVTLDLFGGDVSSNAASYYTTGLKGRYEETRVPDDHVLTDATYKVGAVSGGRIVEEDVAALTALNERLRDDYIGEVQAGVDRWNKVIERSGIAFRLVLPHKGFHRAIGNFAGHHISPDGQVLTQEQWNGQRERWLPGAEDYTFVQAMMRGRVVEPGKFANWIAPPRRGINQKPLDFEYRAVQLTRAVTTMEHTPKRARKRIEILKSAAASFQRRGYHGASVEQIASALNMTKGNLYYYFKNKEEILYVCHEHALEFILKHLNDVEKSDLPADQKLRSLIGGFVHLFIDEMQGTSWTLELEALGGTPLKKTIAKRDRVERGFRRILKEGMDAGVFAPGDPKLLTFAILGVINWIPRWYNPAGAATSDTIAEVFADYLVNGLLARARRRSDADVTWTTHRSETGRHG